MGACGYIKLNSHTAVAYCFSRFQMPLISGVEEIGLWQYEKEIILIYVAQI